MTSVRFMHYVEPSPDEHDFDIRTLSENAIAR